MTFLGKFKGSYQDLWKAIIRPPRDEYAIKDLGPQEFRLRGKIYKRTDIQIKNKQGLTLECSHFEPAKRVAKELPCVIYLHGNSSSRIEALQAVEVLLPSNITLFCFDFAGCGKSEGEYISLGWFERDDVDTIIEHLRSSGTVSTIGLWGRSMGAVTSLMHADRDPSIGGIVLDSPFSDLRLLSEELVKNHTKIPKLIVSGAMALIRSTIKSKAKFDIDNLVPMNHVAAGFVPALFVAGKEDNFIDPHHAKDLYEKYAGDKNIVIVDGDHNSPRPQFLLDSISIFFYNTLLVDSLPKEAPSQSSDKSRDKIKLKAPAEEENSKEPERLPTGGGFGFKDAYSNGKGQQISSKRIGNDDDIYNILEDVDEEELRKAIEESLKLAQAEENNQNQNQGGPSKPEGGKVEKNPNAKLKGLEGEKRNGGLSDNEGSDQEEEYMKIPFDIPEEEKVDDKKQ